MFEAPKIEAPKKIEPLPDYEINSFMADIKRVGPNEGEIFPVDLFGKYENLLKNDINALSELLISLQKLSLWNSEVLAKIKKICESYLKKPDAYQNAIRIAEAIGILKRNDMGETIILDEIGGKRNEKAIPPILIEFVNKLEQWLGGKLEQYLKKTQELNEDEFLKLMENLHSESRLVREKTLQSLLSSKKKPFENIATFQQIIKKLILNYKVYKHPEIINLIDNVLENGRDLMEQDRETKGKVNRLVKEAKIDKLIAEIKEREKEREDEKNKINEIFKKHIEEIEGLLDDEKYEEALDKIVNALKIMDESPKLSELYDDCATAIVDKGLEFKKREEYDKALACFTFILKRSPMSRQAIENLTVCSFLKSQKEHKTLEGPPDSKSLAAAKSGLNENGVKNDIKTVMENIAKGEVDIAKLILEELNKKNPDNPGVIHCLSICYLAEAKKYLEETAEAQKYLDKTNKKMTTGEESKKRENVLKAIPSLTKFLIKINESIKLQKYLVDKGLGKDFLDESQIFTSLMDVLKICKAFSEPYMSKIEKWLEKPDSTLSAEEIAVLSAEEIAVFADFTKAEADLTAFYYPQRKFSIWDLINVSTVNEGKKRIIEETEGIPVKIDTVARMEAGIEKINAENRVELLISITQDKAFINVSKELVGILHGYKRDGHMSPDYGKAFNDFKTNLIRLMLKGGNNEKFGKIAWDTLMFMENKDQFLQLAKLKSENPAKSDLPKKRWGEESIDPKIEMGLNMDTLNLYLTAIKMEPGNMENYEALFGFLDKIHFEYDEKKISGMEQISLYRKVLKDFKSKNTEDVSDFMENMSLDYFSGKEVSGFLNSMNFDYFSKNPKTSIEMLKAIEGMKSPDNYEAAKLAGDIRWYLTEMPIKGLMKLHALGTKLENEELRNPIKKMKETLGKKPADKEKLESAELEVNEITKKIISEKIEDLHKMLDETKFPEKIKREKIEILEIIQAMQGPDNHKAFMLADDIISYVTKMPTKDLKTLDELAARLESEEMKNSIKKMKNALEKEPVNKEKLNSAETEVNTIIQTIMSEKIEALRKLIDGKELLQKLEEKRSGKLSGELRDSTLNKIKLDTSFMSPESAKVEQEKAKQLKVLGDDATLSLQPPVTTSTSGGADFGGVMFNISIKLDAISALFKKLFGKK